MHFLIHAIAISALLISETSQNVVAQNKRDRKVNSSNKEAGASRPLLNRRLLEHVDAKLNISYAGNTDPRQQLDLFLPKTPNKQKLPLIVFIHGGGWKQGDKSRGYQAVIPFVETGDYIGASINYRLSSQAQFPAQIHDCKAAIRWLRGNAKEYGIHPDKIGVMGTSAGGHLVALLGTTFGEADLEGTLGEFKNESSQVSAVVDYFGPTNFETMSKYPSKIDHDAATSPEGLLLGGAIPNVPIKAKQASPMSYVSKDDAPFLIIHGTDDPLVPIDQSIQLDNALDAVDVPSALITISKGGHGGMRTPQLDEIIQKFFDKHLRGQSVNIPDMTLPL